ncbi:MAG: bifunctional enoyl-CoA hydratase/phosphate acetyltransferase [Gammaproteobacteria bacterium]|nr:bifunctional enoyl-CoA hydratase/phosphate acetyltransferase [Gammaproteobacteria bacterium]
MEYIENRTFAEIAVGDSARLERRLTMQDIKLFAVMSGDVNPAHVDEDYAHSSRFHEVIAHGMWGGALISTVLGTELPGPGTIYLGQTLRFRRPVRLGDRLTVTITVRSKDADKPRVVFDCSCVNQDGEIVIEGEAQVLAPTEKIRRPRTVLPEVRLRERAQLHRLLEAAGPLELLRTAVVHPVDAASLRGAVAAAEARLITPLLIGPEARIRACAEAEALDISSLELIAVDHSHAAVAEAVALARAGRVDALMRGHVHVEELLAAVSAEATGLRTGRCLSHISAFDVPTYPRPLFITDTGVNIYPTLDNKLDIIQNAIDFVRALGVAEPRVAVLSAVETVTSNIHTTIEAAALCKMAERGQITGGLVDGPLGFDNAISATAAAAKGIASPVAGQADILVVPDVETGIMLAKQLQYLADAEGAGVVLGARVPIVLTGRADDVMSRLASCALAALHARQLKNQGQSRMTSAR